MKRAVLALALLACGTLSDETEPSAELPSAEMGPFRALQDKELKGAAPWVLDDSRAQYRDPAVLADGAGVLMYAVSGGKIVRTRALDGRTFYGIGQAGRSPPVVLAPDQPWEGAALAGPFALRRGAVPDVPHEEVLLFYAGAGGIGVARSPDGLAFAKSPGPLLAGAAPSVFALPSGELRMLFTTADGIAEARSSDGVAWTRVPGVVLAPSGDPGAFDALEVADPCVAVRTTPAGRFHVRVLYTGTSVTGAKAIGFAARYGEDGPLARNAQPALAPAAGAAQPAYAPPFLYFTEARLTYPAIAGAIEPLDATLGAPADFPPTP